MEKENGECCCSNFMKNSKSSLTILKGKILRVKEYVMRTVRSALSQLSIKGFHVRRARKDTKMNRSGYG